MAIYYNPMQVLGQMTQQNPFYNPFSPYPNIGGIGTMLQQLYALKQLQEQQQLKQEQWQKEYELAQKRVGLTEKGLELEEQRLYKPADWIIKAKALSEATGKPLSETIPAVLGYTSPEERLRMTEETEKIRAKYRQPSTFREKLKEIKEAYKQGVISSNEFKEGYKTLLGIQKSGGDLTQYQVMNARENIARNIRTLYNNYIKQRFGTQPKGKIERVLIKPKTEDVLALIPQGIDLRFPQKFNIALARLKNGVATEEDRRIVKTYLDMADEVRNIIENMRAGRINLGKDEILKEVARQRREEGWDMRWFKFWLDNPDLWYGEKILGYEYEVKKNE